MMRKFNKRKVSRRGAILVTVVFILAFATIFIAAAMSLTQATRKRIYTEAHSDQARLTVTSVAEAFYNAINMCEFDDDTMVSMCQSDSTIRIYASDTTDVIPGLETDGAAENNDSYTSARFYRQPNTAGAAESEHQKFTYYVDFSTHIYGKVENVRAKFSYTPQTYTITTGGAPFDTQIDLNTKFSQNNLVGVGDGDKDPTDNIFLVRKGGLNIDSGFSTSATMIYCDGQVGFKAENFQCEDLVFLQGAVLHNFGNGVQTNWDSSSKVKNLFFFGDSQAPTKIADSGKGNFSGKNLNFFLCNRTADDNNSKDWIGTDRNNKVYYISANGDFKSGTSTPGYTTEQMTAFKKKVQKYAKYNEKYRSGGTHAYPTTDEFLKSTNNLPKVGGKEVSKVHPSGSKEYTLQDFADKYCYQNWQNDPENGTENKGYLPAGNYYFISDGGFNQQENNRFNSSSKICEPYVIVLKSDRTYRFYFAQNKVFKPCHMVFIIDKPDPANPALFILESGAQVYWPGNTSGVTWSNGKVGSNGIFAVKGRNKNSAQDCFNWIINLVDAGSQDAKSYGDSWGLYDGKNEPCAMVLGMGKNYFILDKAVIMEAFIGMFNENYDTDGQSKVAFRNGDSAVFYGRLMTDGIGFQENGGVDSGAIYNPACPGSSTLSSISGDGEPQKLRTGFQLTAMIYYYDLPTVSKP